MQNDRPLERLSVLVVEDEYFLADELKQLLKQRGAQVVRLSGNIDDAFEQVKAGGFNLALVDINIHGDNAYSVADELQRQRIPFAFVSGYDRTDIPTRFAKVPLWNKPFDMKRVAGDVGKLLKAAKPFVT